MRKRLQSWQKFTNDPWICSPHAVYEDRGAFATNPQCLPLYD